MILAAAAALALAPAAAPAPRLGTDVGSGASHAYPHVDLWVRHPRGAEPGFYRRVQQIYGAHLQAGTYPAAAFAARREGTVGVSLDVDAAGRVTGCRLTAPSGAASLDAHACPHLRRAARFHPALDERGVRRGATVRAELSYVLARRMHAPGFVATPSPDGRSAPPRLLAPISPALAGIGPGTPQPRDVWSIGGELRVDSAGAVTACTLYEASWDDRLDKAICDRLRREVRFEPARDRDGRPVAASHSFGFGWPQPGR